MNTSTPRHAVGRIKELIRGLRDVVKAIPTGTLLPLAAVLAIMFIGLTGMKVPEAAASPTNVAQLDRLGILEAELAAHLQALDEHMAVRSEMSPVEQANFDQLFRARLAALKAEITSTSAAD